MIDSTQAARAETTPPLLVPPHLVSLPGTDWTVWRFAELRSAGFPVDGLELLTAPDCAAVADAHLDGAASADDLTAAFRSAEAANGAAISRIAADPLFREAVVWQNPRLSDTLAALGTPRPDHTAPHRKRSQRDRREDLVARYWQRYCAKNDTIGFFGPVAWGTVDPAEGAALRHRSGPALTRVRETFLEFWALQRYADRLAADPLVRPWLPVALHPHLTVDGATVRHPDGPVPLSDLESRLLSRCDGATPAIRIAEGPDGLPALEKLAARGVLRWGVDMPYNPTAHRVLRERLAAIGDPAARALALTGLDRLDAARAAVAAAAGDPDALSAAMDALDAEFTAVTGDEPEHRAGQMYAGRRLCYEETVRDLHLTIGAPMLAALAGPLGGVLLPAARWVSATLADTYRAAWRDLYHRLRAESGDDRVPMTRFWAAAQDLITGTDRPADRVAADFADRWATLFGLRAQPPDTTRITLRSADLTAEVARLFPAERPGWPGGRIHSPDIHIAATGQDALDRGDFSLVLGEMHAAWPTLDCAVFVDRHENPELLYAAAAADIGTQFRPLYPTDWPRYTARIAPVLGRTDHQFAFAPAPGADPARLIPITAVTVHESAGRVLASTDDGRSWPVEETFELFTGWLATGVFKLTAGGAHDPRVTLDRLVVCRETWRTTVGDSGLARVNGPAARYLAARALRRALRMPERVFASLATEVKPVYLDFTSPRYVSAFCTLLRSARQRHGDDVAVTFTELLPDTADSWLADATGRRYLSELRLQFRDPAPPDGPDT